MTGSGFEELEAKRTVVSGSKINTGRARNTRFRIAIDRALADSLAFPRSVETLMRKLGNLAFSDRERLKLYEN